MTLNKTEMMQSLMQAISVGNPCIRALRCASDDGYYKTRISTFALDNSKT
jgi:hypothetical protein